jgi:DNA-binding response OmpR family regulator
VVLLGVDDQRELSLALGVDEFFLKPVDVPQLAAAVRRLAAPGGAGEPVLIIDDDPGVLELLTETLRSVGIPAITASSGEQGLALAATRAPAVIVLDLMMVGMNGFEVAQRLAQDAGTARIPIIVLTAKDLTASDRRRLSGQVVGTFGKGPAPGELVRAIEALLRRRRQREGATTA